MTPLFGFITGVGVGVLLRLTVNATQDVWDERRKRKSVDLIIDHVHAVATGDIARADQTQAALRRLGHIITVIEEEGDE